jgi:hypothetical protein
LEFGAYGPFEAGIGTSRGLEVPAQVVVVQIEVVGRRKLRHREAGGLGAGLDCAPRQTHGVLEAAQALLLHREDHLALAYQHRRGVVADVADRKGHVRVQPGILPDVPEGVEVIAWEAA